MASCSCYSVNFAAATLNPNKPLTSPSNQLLPASRFSKSRAAPSLLIVGSREKAEPLRVMISGAPASGKGTQCELITKKYDLVHVAAGDLLRAEVASGTENGKRAKEFMEKGQLVPNEIVVMMVKERLSQQDSQEKGWLLDGYPRSESQATALKKFGFAPDIFILLEVKLRLLTHNSNVEAVLSMYSDITVRIDGSLPKQEVFSQIDSILTELLEKKEAALGSLAA
ncbi:hypothetical protein DH2020_036619 [Rehmannia glutinosa]|uniref:adenylate kinase n=1 Tax=Rehmannia glutinosa TaxID=99300 RepID=A0ABR0V6G3_REHGL